MTATELNRLLEPFKHARDPKFTDGRDPRFPTPPLHVSRGHIAMQTMRGQLSLDLDLGIETPFAIDALVFCKVMSELRSDKVMSELRADAEVTFRLAGHSLAWHCDTGNGQLPIAPLDELYSLTSLPPFPNESISASPSLALTLRRGALSCTNYAMASVGLNGVLLACEDGKLYCASSDDVTLSIAWDDIERMPASRIVLSPDDVNLLARIIRAFPEGAIAITRDYVMFRGQAEESPRHTLTAIFSRRPDLKHDLMAIARPYLGPVAACHRFADKQRIRSFLRYVTKTAETKERAWVSICATTGRIALRFAEALNGWSEDLPAPGLSLDTPAEFGMWSDRLRKAILYCDQIAFDHVDQHVLAFDSADGKFRHLIARQSGHAQPSSGPG